VSKKKRKEKRITTSKEKGKWKRVNAFCDVNSQE
jgi:hypothetical protein